MAHIPERRSLRRRLRPYFTVFDLPLTLILAVLVTISMITMSSVKPTPPGRVMAPVVVLDAAGTELGRPQHAARA